MRIRRAENQHYRGFFLSISFFLFFLSPILAQPQCAPFAPPAVLRGRHIYNSISGEPIPVRGVNYYPRPNAGPLTQTNSIDFFTDEYQYIWERDIAYFKALNVNVVRVYAVQPGVSHDGFLCALKAAGIYLVVGLAADCLDCAITTTDTAPACYPAALKERGQFIIAEFARYDNVLAFSAGNEVSLSAPSPESNGPCQKQFIRDMRAYIDECQDTIRRIPVGLAIADVEREEKIIYYSCRSDPEDELENAEFIGLNTYIHCDGSLGPGDRLIGYETLLEDFATYEVQVPVMLTEFGCVNPSFASGQRNFLQVDRLFSPEFREQFAGGIVFEYNTELLNSLAEYPFSEYGPGNFGLGYFSPEDCDDLETKCNYNPFPQFETLASKYLAVDVSNEPLFSNAPATEDPPTCPSQFPPLSSFDWPSAATADRSCPGPVYVTCPAVPDECTGLGVPYQGLPPTTEASINATTVSPTPMTTDEPMVSSPSPMPTTATSSTNAPTVTFAAATSAPTKVEDSGTSKIGNRFLFFAAIFVGSSWF